MYKINNQFIIYSCIGLVIIVKNAFLNITDEDKEPVAELLDMN